MAVALDTENELMSSLAKRRSDFRNSFNLKSLSKTGEESVDGDSLAVTSLTQPLETSADLLADLKERRLKRKALLKPISESELVQGRSSHSPKMPILDASSTQQSSVQLEHENTQNNDPQGYEAVGTGMRKLRALRSKIRKTRFDSLEPSSQHRPLPSLSATAPPSGIATKESSHRWRLLSAQLGQVKQQTLQQQSMDFFTGTINQDDTEEDTHRLIGKEMVDATQLEEEGPKEEASEQQPGEDHSALLDQQVPSQEEHFQLLGKEEESALTVCRYKVPSYTPYRERVFREKELYFIPSTDQVPPEQKTPNNAPPVYREETGLHIGHRPKVSSSNQAIMENRLLKRPDEGKGMFGEDGLLKVEADPVSPLVTRPLILAYEENKQVVYKQPVIVTLNKYLIKSGQGVNQYQMEFYIGQLQFQHHPLFSVEHVLASMLTELCTQYRVTDRHKMVEHLRQKLHALEYTIHNMEQSLEEEAEAEREDQQQQAGTVREIQLQLTQYQEEMRAVRHQLKQTEASEYRLVRSILETWQDIKRVREEQGYCCTNVQITVQRILPDVSKDEAQWERDVQLELNEQREEFEAANHKNVLAYKAQLSQWKDYERQRRRALRQQKSHSPSITDVSQPSLDTTAQLDTESVTSIPPEKPRPVAPPTFNEEQAQADIVESYRQRYRKPGEPILIPQLTSNHPITQQCPREEQQRRDAVSATRYRLRVFYNEKEICATKDRHLNSNFVVTFNEYLTVQVVEWPQVIKLQLVDTSSLLPSTLTDLFVPIPDSSTTSSSSLPEEYQFSINQTIQFSHTGVGAGLTHPLLPRHGTLVTGGRVHAAVCWGESEDGRSMCPPGVLYRDRHVPSRISAASNVLNIKKWIEEAHLDPNDPRNFELLDLAKSIPSSAEETSYFRLQSIDDTARFVSDQSFANNKRFILIQLREQGHPALKGKSIPLNEESITESLWKSVQEYKPFSLSELPVTIFGNFYDGRKEEREKYLLEVREKVLGRTGTRPHNKITQEDVIHEELIPNISSLRSTILDFFSPRQPLKPKRSPYHKPKPQNVHVEECHVSVRIVRAMNVPVRGEQHVTQRLFSLEQNEEQQLNKDTVKPFIEVSFGRQRQRTTTSHGPHPHWNEEVVLPFHPPENDFSPAVLQKVTDELRFDLYDETVVDLLQDERHRDTDLHHRVEKKWLGMLAIPFSTLHGRTRIEGTFQMDTPPVCLGYHHSPSGDGAVSESRNIYIQLFIALEPALTLLPPISDKFDSAENSSLLGRADSWLKSLREKYPSRNYQTTALDINGKNVFLTRFVLPQNPPPVLLLDNYKNLAGENLLHCMERLAWFVSLIPFLPDAILFSGTCDIWATTNQFLHMLGGDEEEHAMLLCNYFLYLDQEAWMILGHAIPEGPTAYVLTRHPTSAHSYMLWNPSTGRHFQTTQSNIPLISIGTIFNQCNIWGNVQEWDTPGQVHFDLQSSKHWTPLFLTTLDPLPSVQMDTLNYSDTDLQRVQSLQARIDQIVHSHIEQLRVRHLTRWNRYCSRLLQNSLPRFEETPFTSASMELAHCQELKETFQTYKILGYPLNLRCSDTNKLLETVERTGLHLCEHERVEFGLGVYIHSYPNDVLSVWVYLVTLVPK